MRWLFINSDFLKDIFFESQSYRETHTQKERERKRERGSIQCFTSQIGHNCQVKVRSFRWVFHTSSSVLGWSSAIFPGTMTGKWVRSAATCTWTSAHMAWCYHRWKISLLCCNVHLDFNLIMITSHTNSKNTNKTIDRLVDR